MHFLSHLDAEQRDAVTHGEGPLLVVAGAGSGKTRVLTYRMAWLLASGRAQPHNLLAVTFTNKAAREMAERVERLLGGALDGGFVGTFHRFALQLLRRHPHKVGLPARFAVADEDEQRKLVEAVLRELGIGPAQLSPRAARAAISRLKNGAEPTPSPLVAEVARAYQEKLVQAGAVDFDDMLTLSVRLLSEDANLRQSLRERFIYLLVDEFQDTNPVQMELLWQLGGPRPNLTAVGDEDQSIYRFRGAEVTHILRFEQTYPGARVLTLGTNYRSAEPILQAAATLIAHNTARRPKRLRAAGGAGEPVKVMAAADEVEEAAWVVADLRRQRAIGRSVAVLFRINACSRPFEAELVRWGVAYRVVGGMRFWDRAEVRDAVAYLRLVANPNDELAFRRVVNVPARGIGAATLEKLGQLARERGCSLPEASRRAGEQLAGRARTALQDFWALVEGLQRQQDAGLGALVRQLLQRSGLASQYQASDPEDQARLANLDQLLAAAVEAEGRGLALAAFLDEIALLTEADSADSSDAVLLSTLHAAKGLEFDVVYLVGLEDGLLPLVRGDELAAVDEEEERRLLYVGMTRAKKKLVLTFARSRRLHGEARASRPSRFLAELPPELVRPLAHSWARGKPVVPVPSLPREHTPPTESGFSPGMQVEHPSFGRGVVLQVQATGAQSRLVVFFPQAGRKTLLPQLAKLKVVSKGGLG